MGACAITDASTDASANACVYADTNASAPINADASTDDSTNASAWAQQGGTVSFVVPGSILLRPPRAEGRPDRYARNRHAEC